MACILRGFLRGHSFSTYARRGGGGSSKCVRMRTRGEGGSHMKYVRKAKNYQLFAYIRQQLVNEVRIQVKLLLVQGCQAYGPQAESDNVAPRNFE